MKVHIAHSAHNLTTDIDYIRTIAKVVRMRNGIVLVEGYEAANTRLSKNVVNKSDLDWDEIIKTLMRAIDEADLIIIEGSVYGFSSGFWSALSLLKAKPTLFLYRQGPNQFPDLDAMFVSGLMSDLFTAKTYHDEKELEEVVAQFIQEYDLPKKEVRLELDQKVDSYLDQASRKTGKQKPEVIKDILMSAILKEESATL
jgi:hypothetical protein